MHKCIKIYSVTCSLPYWSKRGDLDQEETMFLKQGKGSELGG